MKILETISSLQENLSKKPRYITMTYSEGLFIFAYTIIIIIIIIIIYSYNPLVNKNPIYLFSAHDW